LQDLVLSCADRG